MSNYLTSTVFWCFFLTPSIACCLSRLGFFQVQVAKILQSYCKHTLFKTRCVFVFLVHRAWGSRKQADEKQRPLRNLALAKEAA